MNNLLEIMLNRRSIRKYTDESISDDKLELIMNAGMAAPRGRGKDSVELILVRDRASLEALSHCRPAGPGMLAGADACIVVIGNENESDVWTEDCCIAMTQMHLMADSLGVGSCWVQGRLRPSKEEGRTAEDVVKDLLGIPDGYRLEAMLALGMPAEEKPARSVEELRKEMLHCEKF
ncbi:MAG: nitroreductase family protein [Firmicutes bacterium]|nr:nitroreductase family protein [Bacillota bacterium]